MTNEESKQPLMRLITAAVALAMGVATIVLTTLGSAPSNSLLAIGVTALALNQLMKHRA